MSAKATESLEQFETSRQHSAALDDPGHAHLVRNAAVLVAVLAAFLAIATFFSEGAMKQVVTGETRAADVNARLEANDVKTTVAENDATLLRAIATGNPADGRAAERAAAIEERLVRQYGPIDEHLKAEVVEHQHERDHAEERHRLFELASVGLQIAIVIASISIIARSLWLLRGGGVLGIAGAGLLVAGLLT